MCFEEGILPTHLLGLKDFCECVYKQQLSTQEIFTDHPYEPEHNCFSGSAGVKCDAECGFNKRRGVVRITFGSFARIWTIRLTLRPPVCQSEIDIGADVKLFTDQILCSVLNQRASLVISCRGWKHSWSLSTAYTARVRLFSVLFGFWLHKIETMPHIVPFILVMCPFQHTPLSVNDEQSERSTKDNNTVHNTVVSLTVASIAVKLHLCC